MQGTWRKKGGEAGDELALSDILGFFRSNWKRIGLLTLLFSALAIGLALLLPDQYSKQVRLAVRPVATDLQVELGQLPILTPKQAGDLAVGYIQNADLGEIDASPSFDTVTQWTEVAVQSRSRDALENVGPRLVDVVETEFRRSFEANLGGVLQTQITQLGREVENGREALARIERQIADSPPIDTENVAATIRLQVLETKRADETAALAVDENRLSDLREAQRDLPQRADGAVVVEVVSESGVPQARSLTPVIALAILSSLLLAVAVAIVRTAVGGSKRTSR